MFVALVDVCCAGRHEMCLPRLPTTERKISMDLPERSRKLFELLKVDRKKVHLDLSVTESGKEGEGKREVSNPYLRRATERFRS